MPDQFGAGIGRGALRGPRDTAATVLYAVDVQKVKPARVPVVVLYVERAHVKLEWHILLDDAVLVLRVLLAGAEVVGVHAPVVFDRARSGDKSTSKAGGGCCVLADVLVFDRANGIVPQAAVDAGVFHQAVLVVG